MNDSTQRRQELAERLRSAGCDKNADRWIQSRGLRQWGHYLDGSGQAAAAGRRYLRLDCVAENEGLNRYYSRRFQLKGTGENIGRCFSLYEKPCHE